MSPPEGPQQQDRASDPEFEKRKTVRLTEAQLNILRAVVEGDSGYANESDVIRAAIELFGEENEARLEEE